MPNCAIVGEAQLLKLMLRYLGEGPHLTHDETEILLFALYMESKERGGLASAAVDVLEARLKKLAVASTEPSQPTAAIVTNEKERSR